MTRLDRTQGRLFALGFVLLLLIFGTAGEALAAPCQTLEAYGGSGDGTTDNAAAWNSALSAIGAANGCIELGAGTYKSTTAINISLSPSTNQSVTIRGAGPRTTVIYFPNRTNGIVVTMPVPTNGLDIADMTIATGQVGGNNGGLVVNSPCSASGGVVNFGTGPQRLVDNVDFRGFDSLSASTGIGNQYWTWGLLITNASFFNIRSVTAYGPLTAAGTGVLVQGSDDQCASAIFNISQGNFQRLANGFAYGTAVQGVNIVQSNFVDNMTDIACPPTSKNVLQLTASANQFDNGRGTGAAGSIVIGCSLSDILITGNLFYAQNATNSVVIGGSSFRYTITGNVLCAARRPFRKWRQCA